jgi:hypothetical protein
MFGLLGSMHFLSLLDFSLKAAYKLTKFIIETQKNNETTINLP